MSRIEKLRKLASEATPLFPLELLKDDEGFVSECPACDGNGYIEDEATWDSRKAASLQAFGIGVSLESLEAYVAEFSPDRILALLSVVEELRGAIRAVAKNTEEAPLLTDGTIQRAREALAALKAWEDGET